MALPPLATVEDLEARLGVSLVEHSADYTRAEAALDDASALIRNEAGFDWADAHDALDFGTLSDRSVDAIQQITLAVAYRAYKNPDGTTQASVGDVSVSYGRDTSGGSVYLTKAERAAIRKAVGVSAVVSVPLTTPYLEEESAQYVDVEGGEPMLFGLLPGDWVV